MGEVILDFLDQTCQSLFITSTFVDRDDAVKQALVFRIQVIVLSTNRAATVSNL